jgi:hypothetical protein
VVSSVHRWPQGVAAGSMEVDCRCGMMTDMHGDLRYLVHFFNDERYLFKTVTMPGGPKAEDICNAVSSQRGWFWLRYSPKERDGYLQRRRFVERAMYEDHTRSYGGLQEKAPVYFYLIPNLTAGRAIDLARQRTTYGETEPRVVMVAIEDIEDTTNMTFTLNDSHTAYRKRTMEAGLDFGGDSDVPVALPDHGRVFPFAMIEQIHHVYAARRISYEVQVWDHQVLERLQHAFVRP